MWELVPLLHSYVSTALNYSIGRRWHHEIGKLKMSSWKWFSNDLVSFACFKRVPVVGFEGHESLNILSIVMRVWTYSWEPWEFGNIFESHENSKISSRVIRLWKYSWELWEFGNIFESHDSLEIFVMSITDSKAWRKNTGGELAQMFSLILRFNKYKGLSSVNTQNNSACFMSTLDHAMRLRYKNSVQNAILETPKGDWKVALLFRVENATFNLVCAFIYFEWTSFKCFNLFKPGTCSWLGERTAGLDLIFWEQLLLNICFSMHVWHYCWTHISVFTYMY